jgi:molecular chaperone GrpE
MFQNKKVEENNEMSTKKPNYKLFRISQKAVLYNPKDKTFLLVKGGATDSKFYKTMGPWEFPGGRVEKGEKIEESFERELLEEVGNITYVVGQPVGRVEFERDENTVGFLVGYLTIYEEGEIKISDEHLEYKWETAENIEKNKEYKPWVKEWVRQAELVLKSTEFIDGWKRCQADFDNYRKMQDESRKQLKDFMLEDLALQILPVVDNFQMSLDHVPEDQSKSPWLQGILHIQHQLETILKDNGIEEIVLKVGDKFDPNFHEAIENHQEEGKEEQHKIKKIISKGYKIGDKVIRAVKVIVN